MIQISFDSAAEKAEVVSVLKDYLHRAYQTLAAINRKRTWRDSEKAMARADILTRIRVLEMLAKAASVTPVINTPVAE